MRPKRINYSTTTATQLRQRDADAWSGSKKNRLRRGFRPAGGAILHNLAAQPARERRANCLKWCPWCLNGSALLFVGAETPHLGHTRGPVPATALVTAPSFFGYIGAIISTTAPFRNT